MAKNDKEPPVETPADAPETDAATPAPDAPAQDAGEVSRVVEHAVAAAGPDHRVELTAADLAEKIAEAFAKGRGDLVNDTPLSRNTEALNHVQLTVLPGLIALTLKEVFG